MPLYEYECVSCAHRFERIQKFSDPLVDACPKCGDSVRKLLSSPAIQFKGSGFYITDYPRQGKGGGESSSSSTSEGGDKKTEGGDKKAESSQKSSDTSESKPAATPSKSDG